MTDDKDTSSARAPRPRLPGTERLVAAIVVALLVALILFEFDVLTHFHDHPHEQLFLEIQEVFALGTVIIAGLCFIVYRRMRAQRDELVRRLDAEIEAREALQLALLDPLTGLANRRQFEAIFNATASKRLTDRHALILLDVDDFKAVNDTYGHPAGDRVLQVFSERIRRIMQGGDLVARIGGDEFAIVAFNVADGARAEAIITRLREALAQPIGLEGSTVHVSASAGYTLFPEGGHDPAAVLAEADEALYRAKANKAR